MPYIPGTGWKKVHIYVNDATHADLLIRLRYYNLSQNEFLKIVIKSMIEKDPRMVEMVLQNIHERVSKIKKRNIKREERESKQIIKDFALDPDEVEDIFDILESENPDI